MIVIIADEAFSIIACFDWLWEEYNTVNRKIVTGNENAQLQKFQIMKIHSFLYYLSQLAISEMTGKLNYVLNWN